MNVDYNRLDIYKEYLDKAMSYYYSDMEFLKCYKKVPKSRYYSFKYILDYMKENKLGNILELGTCKSFVDGRFEGCNSSDTKYWEPGNPEKWDWSAGLFTRVFAETLKGTNVKLTTVDSCKSYIDRSRLMCKKFKNVEYVCKSPEDYLKECNQKFDVIYINSGNLNPVEDMAIAQLLEVHLIESYELLNKNGIIIFNDVRNPLPMRDGEENHYGRSKYSIPFLLENNYELLFDEYQVILKKIL